MTKRLLLLVTLLLAFAATAHGQGVSYTLDPPAPGATLRVCTAPAAQNPCSSLASIFSNVVLSTPVANPITLQPTGVITFYAASGQYVIQLSGTVSRVFTITLGGGGGGSGCTPAGTSGQVLTDSGAGGCNSVTTLPNGTLATTQTNGDNTSKIATDAFVQSAIPAAFTPSIQNITPVDYAVDSGAANAYVVAPSPVATSYVAGLTITFKAANANTASSTINVSGLGVKNITKLGAVALLPGDILANGVYTAVYDGTEFVLQDPVLNATPAVVGRVVSGTIDTLTLTVGNQLGVKTIYTSSSAVAVTLTAAVTNGQYTTINFNGTGAVTITPGSGQIRIGSGSLGASVSVTGPGLVGYLVSYDGTNYELDVSRSTATSGFSASGTAALGTSAISSATCATAVTVSATGVLTTDAIIVSFNGDPTAVTGYVPLTTGMLTIIPYPTADNVNFKVCNNTSGSITPGAITLNWVVVRK